MYYNYFYFNDTQINEFKTTYGKDIFYYMNLVNDNPRFIIDNNNNVRCEYLPYRQTFKIYIPSQMTNFLKTELGNSTFNNGNFNAYYNQTTNIAYFHLKKPNTNIGGSNMAMFIYSYNFNTNNIGKEQILLGTSSNQNLFLNCGNPLLHSTEVVYNTSAINDLVYSNNSTDILIYSAYLIIPILIVLFLIKVFRKGIH